MDPLTVVSSDSELRGKYMVFRVSCFCTSKFPLFSFWIFRVFYTIRTSEPSECLGCQNVWIFRTSNELSPYQSLIDFRSSEAFLLFRLNIDIAKALLGSLFKQSASDLCEIEQRSELVNSTLRKTRQSTTIVHIKRLTCNHQNIELYYQIKT